MLSKHCLKDYGKIAENSQVSKANFNILFKNIQWKIATKFVSTLVLLIPEENFVCVKPIHSQNVIMILHTELWISMYPSSSLLQRNLGL